MVTRLMVFSALRSVYFASVYLSVGDEPIDHRRLYGVGGQVITIALLTAITTMISPFTERKHCAIFLRLHG